MSDETYAETWDAERAYKRVRKAVVRMQAAENPPGCHALCKKRIVRMAICANGTCPADLFEQAITQLETHDEIAVGETFLSYPCDRGMADDAIEHVVSEDDPDTDFVGSANQLIASGELEGDT